ncbi:HAD-IIB family hydrolase [Aquabacterium sp. OR-4]|uniref:HAD-IIB family hydrolase n=1 Tax=Aquabacterium sp. OR-4 TaxID=2978127 RepID=UPI0028C9DBE8|nr:HAD-IIB family hydrolase [Aquabacterium sp. OR-4]MDT7837890.1 HAD-IIB family hydrolase [Aquabacterium sp. OR-4]
MPAESRDSPAVAVADVDAAIDVAADAAAAAARARHAGRLRPLAELPPARLAALEGVLTDIDDTLTRDGAVEPVAAAALQALQRAGLAVIAITGRPAGWSAPLVASGLLPLLVAENGGVLLRRDARAAGGVVQQFTVPEAERAARHARLQACAAAVLAEVPAARLATDSAGRLTDIAVDHSEFAQLDAAQIAAVLAVMRRHGLTATVSSIHVNGWLGAHDKWSGACWAVQQGLGRPLAEAAWAYVGDSTNDQVMFERIALSVGVANIARFVPMLQVAPAWLCAGERGAGFAELAQALLAARAAAAAAT